MAMNIRPRWETDSVSKTESVWILRINIFYLRPYHAAMETRRITTCFGKSQELRAKNLVIFYTGDRG
jgi:hypothetical protein